MRAFAFRGRDGLIALTPIPDGANLPSRDGPNLPSRDRAWHRWVPVELDEHVPIVGVDPSRALADIHERGWHLVPGR